MIRRDVDDSWLLIPQIEHARLAAEVAAAWGNSQVPALPLPELLTSAIRHHDNGWRDWDRGPRLDPETGRPRNFTEMPLEESTGIWTASIASAGQGEPSSARALAQLRESQPERSTQSWRELGIVLEAVLRRRLPFERDELLPELTLHAAIPLTPEAVDEGLAVLVEAGVLTAEGEGYEVALPPAGQSLLPALWVSRHFCWLAEKAREHRADRPADVAAAERFLTRQSQQQEEWSAASVEIDPEHWRVLAEAGFRFVQFFDRLSLWLCMQERTEGTELDVPYFGPVDVVPQGPGVVRVSPFPLHVERLTVAVTARRLPARVYSDDRALQEELRRSPVETLEWTLTADT